MTQGSDYSALTRVEESYCVGDVLIASSAVIGNGVMLCADPGCSITIREGACIGPGVVIHAVQGSLEIHQGVCLADGVLIFGSGKLGKQVCVGANSTLINPSFSDCTIISANSLWGDESRAVVSSSNQDGLENADVESTVEDIDVTENFDSKSDFGSNDGFRGNGKSSAEKIEAVQQTAPSPCSSNVIGRQQFEVMLLKMFPDRNAFKQSQT